MLDIAKERITELGDLRKSQDKKIANVNKRVDKNFMHLSNRYSEGDILVQKGKLICKI